MWRKLGDGKRMMCSIAMMVTMLTMIMVDVVVDVADHSDQNSSMTYRLVS